MPDLTTQLHALGDAAQSTVPPISADDVLDRADHHTVLDISDSPQVSRRPRTSRPGRESNRALPIAAAAALVLIAAAGLYALAQRGSTSDLTVAPPPAAQVIEAPGRPVVLRNDGTPIGEQIAALDLPGYLVTIVDGRPLVYDRRSGEEIATPDARQLNIVGSVLPDGIMHVRDTSGGADLEYEVVFSEWTGEESVIEIDGSSFLSFTIRDEDVGLVAVVGTGDFFDLPYESFAAYSVETNERREFELSPLLARRLLWSTRGPNRVASHGADLTVESAGVVYRWSWNNGWQKIATGDVVASTGRHLIVERCDDLATCQHHLITTDGEFVADLSGDRPFGSSFGSSLGGQYAHINGGTAELRVIDADGNLRAYRLEPSDPRILVTWLGESHILLHGEMATPVLLELATGQKTTLSFLDRAAGNPPTFTWVPFLEGVAEP